MRAPAFLPFATAFSLSSATRSAAVSTVSVIGSVLVWVAMWPSLVRRDWVGLAG